MGYMRMYVDIAKKLWLVDDEWGVSQSMNGESNSQQTSTKGWRRGLNTAQMSMNITTGLAT